MRCRDQGPAAAEADHSVVADPIIAVFPQKEVPYPLLSNFQITCRISAGAPGSGWASKATSPLSVPCPAQPEYTLDIPEPMALSICPGIFKEGKWQFAAEDAASYRCEALESGCDAAVTKLLCRFDGQSVSAIYTLDAGGLTVEITGEGDVACLLPPFYFDGESYADIRTEGNQLTVSYGGWECRYTATGQIRDLHHLGGNRNGHYKAFFASATNNLKIRAEICKTEA